MSNAPLHGNTHDVTDPDAVEVRTDRANPRVVVTIEAACMDGEITAADIEEGEDA